MVSVYGGFLKIGTLFGLHTLSYPASRVHSAKTPTGKPPN